MHKILSLVVVCLMCVGCGYPGFKATKNYKWSFDGSDPIPVDVDSYNGSVTVTASNKDEIEVDATVTTRGFTQEIADAALEKLVPNAVIENGKLFVSANSVGGFSNSSVEFVLRVPKETFAKLHTSNGAIRVEGLAGEVDCNTSNGSVQITGVTGKIKLKTSNGSIKVLDCVGEVTGKTSNGSITANFVPVGKANELRTSNGRVSIGLPKNMVVALDASTSNGTVSCELPMDGEVRKKKTSLLGKTKVDSPELPEAKLTIRTSNGSVQFREMDEISEGEKLLTASKLSNKTGRNTRPVFSFVRVVP
jgi:DUF4097 and DUF4098 domain-containing protein YvlB